MLRLRIVGLTVAMLGITAGSILAPRVAHAGGGGCQEQSSDARRANVEMKGSCMIPTVLRVDSGVTVTWVNRDAAPHTVTGAGIRSGAPGSWGSFEAILEGGAVAHTFDRPGVYPYFCLLHPGMVGAVVVGDANKAAFPSLLGAALPPVDTAPASTSTGAAQTRGGRDASVWLGGGALIVLTGIASALLLTRALRRHGTLGIKKRGSSA